MATDSIKKIRQIKFDCNRERNAKCPHPILHIGFLYATVAIIICYVLSSDIIATHQIPIDYKIAMAYEIFMFQRVLSAVFG